MGNNENNDKHNFTVQMDNATFNVVEFFLSSLYVDYHKGISERE